MGLGSILAGIGGAIAAPFTGGASLIPTLAGAAGSALGAYSQGRASNRGNEYAGQYDLARLLMERDNARLGYEGQADRDYHSLSRDREVEGRQGREDAWRKLLSAQRVLSPGARPQLSPYSVAPRQRTGAEREGADALTQEVLARLRGGNPMPEVTRRDTSQYDPMGTIDPGLLRAGGAERVTGVLAPILTGLGRLPRDPQRISDDDLEKLI